MKNLIKASLLALVVTILSACNGSTPDSKTDSVANHPDTNSTSNTVDTLPVTVDTPKTDTAAK